MVPIWLRRLIQERARVAELFALAVNSGMRTLKMEGMKKILIGLTDKKYFGRFVSSDKNDMLIWFSAFYVTSTNLTSVQMCIY